MLKDQGYLNYEWDMMVEWQQSFDEGRDVAHLKGICEEIVKRARTEDCKALATEIGKKLTIAPKREDFSFDEPSCLECIRKKRPVKKHSFTNTLSKEQLKEKLEGAWLGRISGCLLGKPVEGWKREEIDALLKSSNNYPLNRYMMYKEFSDEYKDRHYQCWADKINGIAPVDDDTNYTVFGMKLIETYGKDFTPDDVLEGWLSWIPMFATFTAERVAYKNAAMGMLSPQTATYQNPFREYIGAQIRGDFFGYINPGNTELAAEMAWRDASISHIKNGIYGEMFISAMIAAAFVSDDILTVVEAGLSEIPENCRLRKDIDLVIKWYKEGVSAENAINNIHEIYDDHNPYHWCHTNSNAMIVALGLLHGEKDFEKSICLSVQAAFDTDCNGATVGSIIGAMLGEKGIPSVWYECYSKRLSTSIIDYNEVTVDFLVDKTMKIIG